MRQCAVYLLTRDEARRIAADIASCRSFCGRTKTNQQKRGTAD
jgi:hypothetical protein